MGAKEATGNDELAEEIVDALAKHPGLYYSMVLENSHISRHPMKMDFCDTFCDVFNSYNSGLFDCIRLMVRYEKSLKAWADIVSAIDSKVVKDTLIMDYIHPVFVVLCDTPNAFKDQLVRASAKLAAISKGDVSLLRADKAGNPIRSKWFKLMKETCADTPLGKRLCEVVDEDLFKCPDANHFRKIHGAVAHDLSQTLVSGFVQSVSPADGMVAQINVKSFDLRYELEIVDRQRLRVQNAYVLFCEYADYLQSEVANADRIPLSSAFGA